MSDLDDLESFGTLDGKGKPNRPRSNFGTIGRSKIKCAGMGGLGCDRPGVIKGVRLWYCRDHAPRGSGR